MRKLAKIALFVPALLVSLISTTTAAETFRLVFDEQAFGFIVEDKGEPGESVGDYVYFYAILYEPGTFESILYEPGTTIGKLGEKNTKCEAINQRPDGKFILSCQETITISGGTILTEGKIDQARFERPKFEKLPITGGDGEYAGASGQETAMQTRYPDLARIELTGSLP